MNIDDLARDVAEQDEARDLAALEREKAKFGFAALDAQAEQRLAYLAGRASEISQILKATAFNADTRAVLVKQYPGRDVYYQRVEDSRDRLRDLTFGAQSRLTRARAALAGLTPSDLLPNKDRNEQWLHFPRWGFIAPAIFAAYAEFGKNLSPTVEADIDEAITRVETAFEALQARLQAIVGHGTSNARTE